MYQGCAPQMGLHTYNVYEYMFNPKKKQGFFSLYKGCAPEVGRGVLSAALMLSAKVRHEVCIWVTNSVYQSQTIAHESRTQSWGVGICRLHLCCQQRCVMKCVYESRTLYTNHKLLHMSHELRRKVWGFLVFAYVVCRGASQTVYMSHELCMPVTKYCIWVTNSELRCGDFSSALMLSAEVRHKVCIWVTNSVYDSHTIACES